MLRIIGRRKPQGGGLRVTRRGRRKYVVIPPYGAAPRKAEAEGANGKEKRNESV